MEKLVYLGYKEPLKKVEQGYGYQGTLAQNEKGDKVQCHICGELFYNLGAHIQSHGMKTRDYRILYGLGLRTPLCSDKASADYKARALKMWSSLSDDEQKKKIEHMREVAKKAIHKRYELSTEELNRKGICPDQLLQKIKDCAESLQKTPTVLELQEFYQTKRYIVPIIRTFGSYKKACEYAGLTPNKTGGKGGAMVPYTEDALITYLVDFYNRTGQPPTASDCHRGLLPSLAVYNKRFGSIQKAREKAGLQVYVSTKWHVDKLPQKPK